MSVYPSFPSKARVAARCGYIWVVKGGTTLGKYYENKNKYYFRIDEMTTVILVYKGETGLHGRKHVKEVLREEEKYYFRIDEITEAMLTYRRKKVKRKKK